LNPGRRNGSALDTRPSCWPTPAGFNPTYPIEQIHEGRIVDRLSGYAIDSPSIEFIRHVSTTGAAALVAEGAAKPETVLRHRRGGREGGEARGSQRPLVGDH
jgi:hypothetical protein